AHDFNNLLMGIQGNASLMVLDTNPDHPFHERLRNIEELVKSGAELTKQLLGFARGGKYEVRAVNLNDLLEKSVAMFGRAKKEIEIHRSYNDDLWTVEVDRGQMEQVLLNLFVNAWQAMPAGGDLFIETANVLVDEDCDRPFHVEAGRYVKLSVTDTGVGMDEATRQRIFEPFFTTKKRGRGTGLGLASVYGIVKNHGGFLDVLSEPGKGTTFEIFLPASGKRIRRAASIPQEIVEGAGTILLVDDEEMVIQVGEEMLRKMGYEVLPAKSGREALDLYRTHRNRVSMVILDLIMPGLSGGETFDRLKELNPDVKVLLSSGYSIDGQAAQILKRGGDGFIQKPFTIQEVSQKIGQIIDGM
ncbi:MAG: response regulator, partial [Deltaproteobacteria bacterium]|nr:response regulator [Deltaproteobacteria bacterium]